MDELLETEAIEVADGDPGAFENTTRPLPATVDQRTELSAWKGEVRTAALAAAGGLVAGAATVAVARATRGGSKRPSRRSQRARERPVRVLASRSFLVDVHLLDK